MNNYSQNKTILSNELLNIINERIKFLKETYNNLPNWPQSSKLRLEATTRRNFDEYYIVTSHIDSKGKLKCKRKYANKSQISKVKKLAQRDYENSIKKRISAEILHLNNFLNTWEPAENVYPSLSNARKKIVTPFIEEEADYLREWEAYEYTGNKFWPEDDTDFFTSKSERVRSKSEVLIANTLNKHGIPYRYECPIQLKNGRLKYPDFTVLNVRSRQEFIWEHFGRMGDPNYVSNSLKKLKEYEKIGYVLGVNLLITMEDSNNPISTNTIEQIIYRFLK
ncbi:MAG: hypothetical protein K5851_02750 [Lachnospiraceae bacterium]|nr:hypothetical protein [Lachnospiraceae bacterium]